jgi:hypothetical protein
MENSRFDQFTRILAAPSRRSLLGSAGASALAALLGWNRSAAKSKKKKNKKKNKTNKKCKTAAIKCGKACINPKTNAQHCGQCGNACSSTAACVNGACQASKTSCPKDQCGTLCVDFQDDEAHCGGCGNACQGDLTCVNGQCACADLADTPCGTACVDLQIDEDHCGRCGNPCNDGQTCVGGNCVGGTCSPPCTGGQRCCYVPVFDFFACRNCCDDNDCLDDPLAVSQGRTICNGFACECPPEAPDNCGGTAGCVDLQTDPAHCGFCNRPVCGPPGDPACDGWECCHGVPRFTRGCTDGFGGWVECQTQHCGSCDNPCEIEGRGCCEGKCVEMVDGLDANANCGYCGANCGDLTCCGARCVNTDNDQFNCGECGEACEGTHACCHGECTRLGTPENCRGCDDECQDSQTCVNSSVGCVSP